MEDRFHHQTDIPDVMNPSGNGFSVDVLVYCDRTKENTVGWFDYKENKWSFLCREPVKEFRWRYFETEIDEPKT